MSLTSRLRAARVGDGARVHIDTRAEIVIDLRTDGEPPLATTDIRCPNCEGTLRVDDLDSVLLAAQMTCVECGFTFLQRLHRGGWAGGSGQSLSWTTEAASRPLPRRDPVDRSRASYFWPG
jgi:hypothetical protein